MKYWWLFLLGINSVWAQTGHFALDDRPAEHLPPVQFTAAYFHNGTINPGLQLSVDWAFKDLVKTRQKKIRRVGMVTLTRRRQLAAEARLGFFWDPLTQVAVFHHYLFSYRLVQQKADRDHPQWTMALSLGPGYLRSFLPETYEVNAAGVVTKLRLASRGYFAPMFSFRLIRERYGKPLNAWFFEINTQWLFDYNAAVIPLNSLAFGYRFVFKKPRP